MGVAVMNDKSGDQKAAFEKILKNYQSAGRDYLTREQFLAVHALKKRMQKDTWHLTFNKSSSRFARGTLVLCFHELYVIILSIKLRWALEEIKN